MGSKIEVKNLTKKFGDLLVLDNMTFEIESGDFVSVVGPTGCGKTTFLNTLTNIYPVTEGKILLDGEEVDLSKHNISYMFQEDSTMEWLTVYENIEFGLKIKKVPSSERKEKVNRFLDLVGLTKYKDYYPKELSRSMLQRVAIARAFATEPDLLLMDEPYASLDIELRFRLEDELIKLWKELGTTIIFITHNVEEAVYLAQNIMILSNKPTTVKEFVRNDLSYPRKVSEPDFVKMRNYVTDSIKWW